VAHRPIPSRRCALTLPDLRRFTLGEDRRISTPSLTAPRLRIHLPKPTLQPYRPRFTFAPRDASPPAAPPPTAKRNPEREERRTKESNRQRRAREAAQAAAARTDPKPDSVLRKTEPKEEMPPPARETAPPGPTAPACQTNREASPSAEPDSAWNPEANREVASRSEAKPERSVARKREPVADFAPTFGGKAAGEPEGFLARLPGWQKAAAALVAVTIAAGAWTYPALQRGERRVSTTAAAVLAPENWETVAAGDAPRQRTIRRYKLAAGKKDYIFEFSGQIDQRAMGWVFRMKDARNYYCWKLERTGEGTSSSSQLVKFAVVDGQEQPHRLSVLREALVPGLPVNVRIEVRGQNFSVEINGKPADTWSDNQLAEGTVGFSNEDGERAAIRSAKVTL
ncbi:MAG TPA: hypothetical protein VFQ91_16690, partial [Bryobacteraceae bacterium]|nr:hypothetical protein [Bryobacteraceae bacterium]